MPREPKYGEVPPLEEIVTPDELALLRVSPYDRPRRAQGPEVAIARRLIARKLLERDPTAIHWMVRCTDRGENVRRPLTSARALRSVAKVRQLAEARDDMAATSEERRLHLRMIAEVGAAGIAVVHLARIVMRTVEIDFHRC